MADGLFVGRMNIIRSADVEAHGHAGVGQAQRAALGVADDPPPLILSRSEARYLYEEEGEVTFRPLAAPVGDERWEDLGIHRRKRNPAVGLALIPDHTLNLEANKRGDHSVVEIVGRPRGGIGAPGMLRRR